jgi:Flp pilus assembly pilin Flp
MMGWYRKWRRAWRNERGSSMVEYMILGVLIIVGLYATIGGLRDVLREQYCDIIKTINPSAQCEAKAPGNQS